MKWLFLLAGGLIGYTVSATIQFIENFDKDYEYEDTEL